MKNKYAAAYDYENPEEYKQYINDQVNDGFGGNKDLEYLGFLTKELKPDLEYSKLEILDVGTREFRSYDFFLEQFGCKITGIDICKVALERAKQEKKPLIELDAHLLNTEFCENTLDLIISFHAFEHMYDLPRVLRHCFNALKPNGYLYFALPVPVFNWKRGHWYTVEKIDDMKKLLRAAGFKNEWSIHSKEGKFRPDIEMIGLASKPS
jgi:SAM-dependent methyltransferase